MIRLTRRMLFNGICLSFAAVIFLSVSVCNAQTSTILLMKDDSSYQNMHSLVDLSSRGYIGANSLDLLFIKKSIFGGKLEDRHLDNIQEESHNTNRAGFLMNGGIDFYNFKDTLLHDPKLGMKISLSTNYHGSLSYTRDLFGLIYRGNSKSKGDTMSPGPLSAQFQSWQKFGVGIFNKKTYTSVSVSLVAGQAFQSLLVRNSNLYTSAVGDSLSLTYGGDYLQSDSAKSGIANGSGLGLCFDFDYNLPLEGNKGFISLSVRDIGFVFWNKQSKQTTFNSSTNFTGIEVNDLFELDTDSINFSNLQDSLKYTTTRKAFAAPLPASISMRLCRKFSDNDFYEAGLTIWPNKAAIPFIYAGLSHFVKPNLIFSERLSFGGYGRWGIGAEVQWMPKGNWVLKAGTYNLGGFTMDSSHSRDIYFTIAKFIRKNNFE
jgi:hypothetical protein